MTGASSTTRQEYYILTATSPHHITPLNKRREFGHCQSVKTILRFEVALLQPNACDELLVGSGLRIRVVTEDPFLFLPVNFPLSEILMGSCNPVVAILIRVLDYRKKDPYPKKRQNVLETRLGTSVSLHASTETKLPTSVRPTFPVDHLSPLSTRCDVMRMPRDLTDEPQIKQWINRLSTASPHGTAGTKQRWIWRRRRTDRAYGSVLALDDWSAAAETADVNPAPANRLANRVLSSDRRPATATTLAKDDVNRHRGLLPRDG